MSKRVNKNDFSARKSGTVLVATTAYEPEEIVRAAKGINTRTKRENAAKRDEAAKRAITLPKVSFLE